MCIGAETGGMSSANDVKSISRCAARSDPKANARGVPSYIQTVSRVDGSLAC